MSAYRLLAFVALFFLFACSPLKPENFTTIIPAGPLIHHLEQRRHSFSSLKALARVEIQKRGHKRVFESVGVVVDDQHRFRLEAYGPVGQSLMAVIWNGKEVLMRLPDEDKVVQRGPAGLADLLGKGLEPLELCAVLSGNIPEVREAGDSTQRCNREGICIFELRNDETVRRIKVAHPDSESTQSPQILSYELFRSDKLLFRARFSHIEGISSYFLPMQIVIESPDKNLQMTIVYSDVELNAPINDDVFTLTDEQEGAIGQ